MQGSLFPFLYNRCYSIFCYDKSVVFITGFSFVYLEGRKTEELPELKNSISPESELIGIRTPERADIDYQYCVLEGNMRNT